MKHNAVGYERLIKRQDAAFQRLLELLEQLTQEEQLALLKSDNHTVSDFRKSQKAASDYYEAWTKK